MHFLKSGSPFASSVLAPALALAVSVLGCGSGLANSAAAGGGLRRDTAWSFFFGITDAEFDISCSSGMATVEMWRPWWGFIARNATFGLAEPWSISYSCVIPQGNQAPVFVMPAAQPMPVQGLPQSPK